VVPPRGMVTPLEERLAWSWVVVLVVAGAAIAWGIIARTVTDDFVYIEDDGSVRETTREEAEYLRETFLPGDGARPYIKGSYRARTPTGSLGGFLPRRKLPRRLRK